MYDWNALWHVHDKHRGGYRTPDADINQLADELQGKLLKSARDEHDLAVYDTGDDYTLLRHDNGLQMLRVAKHHLFDIGVRLVTADEGQALALPYLEVLVDNLATGEEAVWRGEVHCNDEGALSVNGETLRLDMPPRMQFDLPFKDEARFAAALQEAWQDAAEHTTLDAAAWFNAEALEHAPEEAPLDARIQQMCDRYAEIIRREQALLSRRFSDAELHLVAEVLRGVHFESAESCRGLWLAVEARVLHDELDHKYKVDGEALLEKLRALGYTQEVALIEALSPVQH
ncbi:hypothetical protein [Vogesella sp. LIG4]|uniref:hypothetical protein n=1 Tax=Vogesella sp. LIG4 TaxID=1192162 RepID=UPI00081F860F|nr:hypothetical protein [Vogesella sp. LIG4]SCK25308.1 hypothetical protein PSELUDRAFT_3005 [Vogesella sp. LIG4]